MVAVVLLALAPGRGAAEPGSGSGARGADRMPDDLTSRYGDAPEQFGSLTVPGGAGPHPVVVLVHGGFWRAQYGLDLMEPLVADLGGRGFAVWNIEYRRVGQPGGGYPGTLDDVGAALDHLATIADDHELDLDRVAIAGHSAGGHLALWAASRHELQAAAPGADPAVRPRLAIGLAAVADLASAAAQGLGANAAQAFLGGEPAELPVAYRHAQPRLAPESTVLVHGTSDDIVPPDQSERFVERGVQVELVPGEDHFDVIDPTSRSWTVVLDALGRI